MMKRMMEDGRGGEGWRKSCTGRGCTDGVQSGNDSDVIVGALLFPANTGMSSLLKKKPRVCRIDYLSAILLILITFNSRPSQSGSIY